jgi:hypothetical protein
MDNLQLRDLQATFKHFSRLVLDLHVQWQMFRDLHGKPDNYAVINATAPMFFVHLRAYLYDLLFISISRFFDPPKAVWKRESVPTPHDFV